MVKPQDNPYLAHLSPSMLEDAQSPLFGFSFRKVNGAQVRKATNGDINPFTKQPYSGQYKESLKSRKKLPVYVQIDRFLNFFFFFFRKPNHNCDGRDRSGMTTQIPHFVIYSDLPHINGKVVACTQSRSSPTISIARRVASEMDLQLGRHVGYSIRFDDQTKPGTTFLQYMTDEVLLREVMHDPLLERYSTIILDEVHERGVASDILIALLKGITKKRKDLKVIIMSPTRPDAAKFQKYFRRHSGLNAQLFEVPGRTPCRGFLHKETSARLRGGCDSQCDHDPSGGGPRRYSSFPEWRTAGRGRMSGDQTESGRSGIPRPRLGLPGGVHTILLLTATRETATLRPLSFATYAHPVVKIFFFQASPRR